MRAVSPLHPARRIAHPSIAFGPFVLDPANEILTREGRQVRLRPKTFAMLAYLVAAAGRLVTKQDLLDDLWRDVFVGDAALKTCMREIRGALGDEVQRPRYIETAHRRGYRFIAPIVDVDRDDAAEALFKAPRTRYARRNDVSLAYQVVGNGAIDVVFATGWVSHLDYLWTEPSFACFLVRIASFARLILFDTRGTGLSDGRGEAATAAQRVSDIRTVMDAAGSHRAALVGVSDGGSIATLFAATHPERTCALVTIGSSARGTSAPDYPWARTCEQHEQFQEAVLRQWGGPVGIEEIAPSRAADARFRSWWSKYLHMSASPATAVALARVNADLDVREALAAVRAPALILHRRDDRAVSAANARYLSERIAGARLVELSGHDHLPFLGDQDTIVDEIERFLWTSQRREELGDVLYFPPARS